MDCHFVLVEFQDYRLSSKATQEHVLCLTWVACHAIIYVNVWDLPFVVKAQVSRPSTFINEDS